MEYWVSMTEEEIQASMVLFGVSKLEGITELREDQELQPSIFEEMLKKGFFVEKSSQRSWNSFVEAVLRCVFYAQSGMRVRVPGGPLCCLYFRYDNMVSMSEKQNELHYMLYYVPLLPKAIGGLARELKTPAIMSYQAANTQSSTAQLPKQVNSSKALSDVLIEAEIPGIPKCLETLLMADGDCFGTPGLCEVLVRTTEGTVLVSQESDTLRVKSAAYYEYLEDISGWIVKTHGVSISSKGEASYE